MTAPVKFSIQLAELRAVALAAANQDLRFYLNAVAFDFARDGLYLVATDGHRLHAIKAQVGDPQAITALTGSTIIVPADTIKQVKPPARTKLTSVEVAIEPAKNDNGEATHRVTFTLGGTSQTALAIIHRYPDWRRVLPRPASVSIRHDNPGATVYPQYLADAHNAISILTSAKLPGFQYHFVEPSRGVVKEGQALNTSASGVYVLGLPVGGARDFVAFIMPYGYVDKGKPVVFDLPDWLSPPPPASEDLGDLV